MASGTGTHVVSRQVFTFGTNHLHPVEGWCLRNYFVEAPAGMNHDEARVWVMDHFGINWAFQYPNRIEAGVDIWKLQLLEVNW